MPTAHITILDLEWMTEITIAFYARQTIARFTTRKALKKNAANKDTLTTQELTPVS